MLKAVQVLVNPVQASGISGQAPGKNKLPSLRNKLALVNSGQALGSSVQASVKSGQAFGSSGQVPVNSGQAFVNC